MSGISSRILRLSPYSLRLAHTKAARAAHLTDVLIVGGGPAGLTLASAIRHSPKLSGLKVALVDASPLDEKLTKFNENPPSNYTNRVVSLTPRSVDFLQNRAHAHLNLSRVQPYDGLYVTDGCADATLDIREEQMLHMIEILNVQAGLYDTLKKTDHTDLHFKLMDSTKVIKIEHSNPSDPESWPLVTLDNGDQYITRLLVGADGKESPVRKFAGIESRGWNYNCFGIVATMKLTQNPLILRGWQRFLPTGPIAHLPLPKDNATLVWSLPPDISKMVIESPPEQFTQLVNAAFILDDIDMQYYYKRLIQGSITTKELSEDVEDRIERKFNKMEDKLSWDLKYPPLVKSIVSDSRARFPIKLSHTDTYCAERVALIGDAAHTTHPLAGQGLNMGQGDSQALIEALEKAVARGIDIGSILALEPFWAERYPVNMRLLGVADKMFKLYGTDFMPIVALRKLGLNLVNNLPPVKNLLIQTLAGKE